MTFTNIKTKLAVLATFVGLGGLGFFAMTSNPAYTTQAGGQAPLVSTQVAGAGNSAKVAAAAPTASSAPISTRTSGGATVPVSNTSQPVTTQRNGHSAPWTEDD
jgi:hypothetical protein